MNLIIHHLVVGELAGSLEATLLHLRYPSSSREGVLPYGYEERVEWANGSVEPGVKQPTSVWYIEGDNRKILIDTGFDSEEHVQEVLGSHGFPVYARREKEWQIIAALSKVGVSPREIDIVIHTHLHFEHFGNDELFGNAIFVVQKEEIPFCLTPPNYNLFYFQEFSEHLLKVLGRLEAIEGDAVIAPGVEVIKCGGHSPGSMAVLVETQVGTVGIAGDIIFDYKNLELGWPPGIYWRLDQWMSAYSMLKKRCDIILPSHDWKIREYYPQGVIGKE